MFKREATSFEELNRRKKRNVKSILISLVCIIIFSILAVWLIDLYRQFIYSDFRASLKTINYIKILIEFLWLISFLLIFFFVNLFICSIYSFFFVDGTLKIFSRLNVDKNNNLLCFKCGSELSINTFKSKTQEFIEPFNICGIKGYFCKRCFRSYHFTLIFSVLSIPVIYFIIHYIFLAYFRYDSFNYYNTLRSLHFLASAFIFTLFFTFFVLIVSLIFGIVKFFHIYIRSKSLSKKKSKIFKLRMRKSFDLMKIRNLLIFIFICGLLLTPFIYNIFFKQYYYSYVFEYDVNAPYEDDLVNKVEEFGFYNYFIEDIVDDGNTVDDLKDYVKDDEEFKWNLGRSRHLIYYLSADTCNEIYIKQNKENLMVFASNGEEIFSASSDFFWFIFYDKIQNVTYNTKEFVLTDLIFVEMYLSYEHHSSIISGYVSGYELEIKQYVFLNMNLDILLVLLPTADELHIN